MQLQVLVWLYLSWGLWLLVELVQHHSLIPARSLHTILWHLLLGTLMMQTKECECCPEQSTGRMGYKITPNQVCITYSTPNHRQRCGSTQWHKIDKFKYEYVEEANAFHSHKHWRVHGNLVDPAWNTPCHRPPFNLTSNHRNLSISFMSSCYLWLP